MGSYKIHQLGKKKDYRGKVMVYLLEEKERLLEPELSNEKKIKEDKK